MNTSTTNNYSSPEATGALAKVGLLVGVLGMAIAVFLGNAEGDHFRHFFHAYLVGFCWVLAISLGGLFFTIIQHLVNAHWSVTVRRLAEFTCASMPYVAIMSLPLFYALFTHHGVEEHGGLLWSWIHPHGEHAALIEHKAAWLNRDGFAIRLALYLGLWTWMSRFFLKRSLEQDTASDFTPTMRAKKLSTAGIIVYALSMSFAAFDLLMSTSPEWFSTIFGVYYFAGQVQSIMAWLILTSLFLRKRGVFGSEVNTEHYHDLGKFMFAFVFFWGYIAFSQYMLIWYANIPEETGFFMRRQTEAWMPISWALLFVTFVLPFAGLLSRHVKRNHKAIAFWACLVLCVRWIDMTWVVMPQLDSEVRHMGLLEIVTSIGLLGFFTFGFARTAGSHPLLAQGDPLLQDSKEFINA